MKQIREAFDKVYAEKQRCEETIKKLLLPGATIVYSHGCHAIEAEVIKVVDYDRVWVRGFKSGREYTLHPARIEHISGVE